MYGDKAFADVAHSPILTLHRLHDLGRTPWLFYFEKPSGSDAIEEVVTRATRNKFARYEDLRILRERLGEKVYDHPTPRANHRRNNCQRIKCGGEYPNGLYFDCKFVGARFDAKIISIHPAPIAVCKWCKKKFYPRFDASEKKDYFCPSRDCRRINYEANRFQSIGGIDLTPKQAKAVPRQFWDTQRVANYLLRMSREHKRKPDPISRAIKRRASRCAV